MFRGRCRNLLAIILFASACAEAKRLPVRVYTTSDGLALDSVICIVQDSRGFLWFCTAEGPASLPARRCAINICWRVRTAIGARPPINAP